MSENYVGSLAQIASEKIRLLLQFFDITPIDKNCFATGGMAAIHVPPAVAHHPTLCEVDA